MNPKANQHPIQVGFESHTLIGDVMSDGSPPQLLVLHGAGNSNRDRFRLLRRQLSAEGISSVGFDFVGHGETGGELKSSSLRSRTRQARRIVDSQNLQQPFSVIGASMSAYTAVKLLKHYEIKSLILLVPAMYSARADTVPFNRGFTEIIRQPQSWNDSDAWDILAQYKGRLLIVAGENDRIIPRAVIDKIYESAVQATERKLYIAPDATHFIFTDLRRNHPAEFDYIFGLMCRTLKAAE
jgi:pimeloyl-ACP methyl ester carboxylesterase